MSSGKRKRIKVINELVKLIHHRLFINAIHIRNFAFFSFCFYWTINIKSGKHAYNNQIENEWMNEWMEKKRQKKNDFQFVRYYWHLFVPHASQSAISTISNQLNTYSIHICSIENFSSKGIIEIFQRSSIVTRWDTNNEYVHIHMPSTYNAHV